MAPFVISLASVRGFLPLLLKLIELVEMLLMVEYLVVHVLPVRLTQEISRWIRLLGENLGHRHLRKRHSIRLVPNHLKLKTPNALTLSVGDV